MLEGGHWSDFARVMASNGNVALQGNNSEVCVASDKDIKTGFTLFPVTDDIDLVTCKYCQTTVYMGKYSHHYDVCPRNPSNSNKYPPGISIRRDLGQSPSMIKKVNNIKTINDKFNTDKISRKRRGRPPIRRSTQTVSVAEVIAEIVGKIPIIEETEEEDTKIILAANHISTLQPQPLALPHYTRKNNIRRSIARLTSKSSKQVISPLPIAMVGEQCLYNGIQRSSFQRPVNQPTQVNGNQPKDQSSPSSSKKIYFSISPKNGGTSTPTPYISLVSPLRKVAVTKNTPKN